MKKSDIEVTYVQHCGNDLSVVNAARVSFHKHSDVLSENDEKLISYLARNKHFSPFNHAFITLRIKAPIFVARQLVKHKFMPWNEVSRRYVDDEPEFYFPKHWRARADNVKQGSHENIYVEINKSPQLMADNCLALYENMLEAGVAPEQARMVLPQNMMTEWFWSGTLGAYADMLKLRLDPHTQYESRIVAEKVYKEVEKLFPVSIKSLLENK